MPEATIAARMLVTNASIDGIPLTRRFCAEAFDDNPRCAHIAGLDERPIA
jgi:hypothetical protein